MAAIRYLFHRHHLSKRMLGLISEYGRTHDAANDPQVPTV